jgi:hypothetical protein
MSSKLFRRCIWIVGLHLALWNTPPVAHTILSPELIPGFMDTIDHVVDVKVLEIDVKKVNSIDCGAEYLVEVNRVLKGVLQVGQRYVFKGPARVSVGSTLRFYASNDSENKWLERRVYWIPSFGERDDFVRGCVAQFRAELTLRLTAEAVSGL